MQKLKDFCRDTEFEVLRAVNADDVFIDLIKKGITEVSVTPDEMLVIATFFLANLGANEPHLPLLTEGKIDKFFGVKLVLE